MKTNSNPYFEHNSNMKPLFLIQNPELFQGEKYLNTNKDYFEGWYFKNTNHQEGISFIPGININHKTQKAFIQVITSQSSYYINYDIEECEFKTIPFSVKIGNNTFSREGIHIDIQEENQNLKIIGDIQYSNSKNIHTNFIQPNIMGPFSYLPFMECNHAILSMQNKVEGFMKVNHHTINFENDVGYIEKDWGCSFPKSYIWCQGNQFKKTNASFMISIADVPLKVFDFRGIICVLKIKDKEFKFTTYHCAKIVKYQVDKNGLDITLKKGIYELNIKTENHVGLRLAAPVKGKMEKDIFESISANMTVTLKKRNKIIFSDTSTNCGLEIVLE